jgi:fatty acid desaturase
MTTRTRNEQKRRLIEKHRPHWTSTWIWFSFAGALFLLEGLLLLVLLRGPLWAAVPLILIIAHVMHCHLLGLHEAAHGNMCPEYWLNEGIGIFVGTHSYMSLSLFRVVHHSHHAYVATERDEELWPFVLPGTPRWLRLLTAACELFLGLLFTPFLFLRAFLRKDSTIQNPAVRRRIWAELAFTATCSALTIAAVAWWNLWYYWAMMYLVPALLAGFMQSLRKYIEHMGLLGSTILESTRSVVPAGVFGRFLAFTMFNEPYHGVHHKYAHLPQSALPEFSELLTPTTGEEVAPYPSYYHALRDMLRSLSNPRIGAQWKLEEPAAAPGRRVPADGRSLTLSGPISAGLQHCPQMPKAIEYR